MKKVFDIHLHAELNIVGTIMTSRIEHRTITFDIRLELAKILVLLRDLFGHRKAQKIYSTIASYIFIHLGVSVSGTKIPGYPTYNEIRHPVRSLKRRQHVSHSRHKRQTPSTRALRRGLERDERLGQHFSASSEPPWRHQKRPNPRLTSASPEGHV
jgi:hypothetical protein